jgi:hypothetical protein
MAEGRTQRPPQRPELGARLRPPHTSAVRTPIGGAVKVYLSSTFRDLREHRAAVDRALRRMGHDVIGMEQYVAEGTKPLDRCLADVRVADLYLLVLGWRYGYIPDDVETNPSKRSVTNLEFEEAKRVGKPILAFLLDPEAPWPPSQVDAMATNEQAAQGVSDFRSEVGSNYLAGMFRTAEDLASQAAAAVAAQGLGLRMVERLLQQTAVSADDMGRFGGGSQLDDSTVMNIKQMVATAGTDHALVIDLGHGDQWWSTRLHLLAKLLHSLTAVRQIVFRQADGRFAGMASPAAVVDGLAAAFAVLDEFDRVLRAGASSQDTDRETDRHIQEWERFLREPAPAPRADRQTGPARRSAAARKVATDESTIKVGVRPELLRLWLGERLVTRCINVDDAGPTMAQVQQIVESLLPDVPIERLRPTGDEIVTQLQVVDRDAFALELAREWVRSGIPRTPIR